MGRHSAPTFINRTVTRATVATGALAATAVLGTGVPTAGAALPGVDALRTAVIGGTVGAANVAKGVISAVSTPIEVAADAWNAVPGLNTIPIVHTTPDTPTSERDQLAVPVPLIGDFLTRTTSDVGPAGTIFGNHSEYDGIAGALVVESAIAAITAPGSSATNPYTSIRYTDPLAGSSHAIDFIPGGIGFANGGVTLIGPSLTVLQDAGPFGTDIGLSAGSIGVTNDGFGYTGPQLSNTTSSGTPARLSTPVGDVLTGFSGGNGTIGPNGVDVHAPGGGAGVANVLGDNGASVGADGGYWTVDQHSAQGSGFGGTSSLEVGQFQTNNSATGHVAVTDDPSATVGADVSSTTGNDTTTVFHDAPSVTVDAGGVSVTP